MNSRHIAAAAAWIATGAAIIYAIYVTGRISPLWFFLLPGLFTEESEVDDE